MLTLTHSPLWLGVVAGAGQLPYLLFTLAGGSLADRFPRRPLIAIGNALIALLALALALLVARGDVTIVVLAALAFAIGTVIALEHPVDRAWLYDLVEGEGLGRAIALSSLEWSVARTVGPAIGGITLAAVGAATGYATFAATELPMIALALILGRRTRPRASSASGERVTADTSPRTSRVAPRAPDIARSYATLDFTIVPFSMTIAAFTFGVTPYIALLPIIANGTLHADARGFGFLSACGGIGAIAGAVVLSAIGETSRKGRAVPLAMLAGAALLVAFAFARDLALAGAVLAALGAVDTLMYALANTYVQERARDEDRGRANGVFSLAFLGGIPIGNVALGALAARVGAGPALSVGAGVAAVAALGFWFLAPRARDAA